MRRLSNYVMFAVLATMVVGCANQVPLTGGDKDDIPPGMVLSNPPNNSVEFSSKQVKIEFDEMIQLRNASEIVISPLMEKKPKFTAAGKNLTIQFNEPLKDSVTYTINFGKSLVDLNEGNPLEGFRYTFSTYSNLDTIEMQGLMADAFTSQPRAEALVALYSQSALDSVLPIYVTRTNEQGQFSISGIRAGKYFVRAFDDANRDYTVQPNEDFGFLSEQVLIDSFMDSLVILASSYDDNRPIYTVDYEKNRYPIVVFGRALPGPTFVYGNSSKPVLGDLNESRDSFFMTADPIEDVIVAKSYLANDTIRLSQSKRDAGKDLTLSLSVMNQKVRGNKLLIRSNSVIDSINFSGINLLNDSIPIEIAEATINMRGVIEVYFDSLEAKGLSNLTLKIDSGSVFSGTSTHSAFESTLAIVSNTEMSTVSFVLTDSLEKSERYQVYLVDNQDKMIRYKDVSTRSIEFNNILPGEYKLRVVIDANANGIWNSANYLKLTQPEEVVTFGPFRVEEGWDLLDNTIKLP